MKLLLNSKASLFFLVMKDEQSKKTEEINKQLEEKERLVQQAQVCLTNYMY